MVLNRPTDSLARLGTGSAPLDRILGGGLPANSVSVIAGEPGSGKTVFTLQMLFHLARQGKRSLYFTTLSEPAIKLLRYMQLFTFFDPALVDDRIVFVDLGSTIRDQGAERALAEVTRRVEEDEPDLVAIDSFKVVHDLWRDPGAGRGAVYDLAVQMAGWGATTLLIGEYTIEDITRYPEFAIADGIIRLTSERQELTLVRELEVVKLRGADYVTGRHFYETTEDGLTFYPRVRAPEPLTPLPVPAAERIHCGIPGLDELLPGGFPRGSTTLVEGGTGIGKTLFALHFLVEGARQGEPGALFTLEESPDQLRDLAANFGWDLADLEARGLLSLHYTSPVELSTDRFLHCAREQAQGLGARRAVLDSLTSAALGVVSERRFRELVYALTKHFRSSGISLLLTMEVPELLGSSRLTGHGVSSVADNVVLMRYVELGGRLHRAISVLKARGTRHDSELRQCWIGDHGLEIGAPFRQLRGVLTGTPQPDVSAPTVGDSEPNAP